MAISVVPITVGQDYVVHQQGWTTGTAFNVDYVVNNDVTGTGSSAFQNNDILVLLHTIESSNQIVPNATTGGEHPSQFLGPMIQYNNAGSFLTDGWLDLGYAREPNVCVGAYSLVLKDSNTLQNLRIRMRYNANVANGDNRSVTIRAVVVRGAVTSDFENTSSPHGYDQSLNGSTISKSSGIAIPDDTGDMDWSAPTSGLFATSGSGIFSSTETVMKLLHGSVRTHTDLVAIIPVLGGSVTLTGHSNNSATALADPLEAGNTRPTNALPGVWPLDTESSTYAANFNSNGSGAKHSQVFYIDTDTFANISADYPYGFRTTGRNSNYNDHNGGASLSIILREAVTSTPGTPATLTADYAIKVTGTPKTLDSQYTVKLTGDPETLTSSYAVKSDGTDVDLSSEYTVKLTGDPETLTSSYTVKSTGTDSDLSSQYTVKLTGDPQTLTSSYTVKDTTGTADLTSSYAVKSTGTAQTLDSEYTVKLTGDPETLSSSYAVKDQGQAQTLDSEYAVKDTTGTASLSGSYVVQSTGTPASLSSEYEVAVAGSENLSSDYAIKVQGDAQSLSSSYAVKKQGQEQALDSDYSIKDTTGTANLTGSYAVKSTGTLASLSSEYEVSVSQADNLGSSYAVKVQGDSVSLASSYDISSATAGVAVDLDSQYSVKTTGSPQSIDGEYAVKDQGNAQVLSAGYAVKVLINNVNIGAEYTVAVTGDPQQVSSTYAVKSSSDQALTGSYVISESDAIELASLYSVKISDTSEVSSSYTIGISDTADLSASYTLIESKTQEIVGSYEITGFTAAAPVTELYAEYAVINQDHLGYKAFRQLSILRQRVK